MAARNIRGNIWSQPRAQGSDTDEHGEDMRGSMRTPYTEHNITRDQPACSGSSPFRPGANWKICALLKIVSWNSHRRATGCIFGGSRRPEKGFKDIGKYEAEKKDNATVGQPWTRTTVSFHKRAPHTIWWTNRKRRTACWLPHACTSSLTRQESSLLQQQQHCRCIKVCPPHGKPHSWTCVGLYYTTGSVKLSQQHSPFLPHPSKQDCPEGVCKNTSSEIESRPKRERQVSLQKKI